MQFEVKNRWTGKVQFTAEIECEASASVGLKVGLAVKWAYLSGANLRDANLSDARGLQALAQRTPYAQTGPALPGSAAIEIAYRGSCGQHIGLAHVEMRDQSDGLAGICKDLA